VHPCATVHVSAYTAKYINLRGWKSISMNKSMVIKTEPVAATYFISTVFLPPP
jgi:hypothetical protein